MAVPSHRRQDGAMNHMQRQIRYIAAALAVVLAGGLTSCAGTPPIETDSGRAIARREFVSINGRDQGLVIRGHDSRNPILLWLAGGPGGSEIGWTTSYLGALERDVVFVNWDQPGTGLSWRAADWDTVEVQDFVNDTIALTEYLRERFHAEKIILAGHSWGSIVGLMAVDQRPDLFAAYLGVAQQVNARENDRHGYEMVLQEAASRGDHRVVSRLREMGPPPYGREHGRNYVYLFQKLHVYSPHPSGEPSVAAMLFPPEYRLRDSINAVRGVIKGVRNVYPQLEELDFGRTVPRVSVPVFFFTGRYDETCVQDITRRYFEALEAPHKEFVWFEHSGHNLPYHEPERFVREVRTRILNHVSKRRNTL